MILIGLETNSNLILNLLLNLKILFLKVIQIINSQEYVILKNTIHKKIININIIKLRIKIFRQNNIKNIKILIK